MTKKDLLKILRSVDDITNIALGDTTGKTWDVSRVMLDYDNICITLVHDADVS